MKKILATLALVIGSLNCFAQQNNVPTCPAGGCVSPNLIYTTQTPYNGPPGTQPYTWSGFVTTTSTGGGVSGGNQPGYNTTTGTFMFGYTTGTINYNYALNTALKNSGMSWLGYNYSLDYINQEMTRGTLTAKVVFNGVDGTALNTKNWTLDKTTDGWKTVKGTEIFTNPLLASNINSFDLSFTGKDDRFWAGYYGPQVRNLSVNVNYTFDACSSNPLSSPTCPGYAEAYKAQQCVANPLYDRSCPGYSIAYKTQQCAISALYSPDCPGYAEAYKTEQCTINPLYDKTCTGYAEAYKTQQCTINPLYDKTCAGYAEAYKTQQCTTNPLYDKTCTGYEQAYLNAQCIKDSLYSTKCEGYATAYAIKNLVNLDPAVTSAVNQQLTTNVEIAKADPAKVTIVNTTVDSVLSTPSTTSATSVSPGSVISVIAPPPPSPSVSSATTAAAAPLPPPSTAKQEEKVQEQKKTDTEVAKVEKRSGGDTGNAKKEVTVRAVELAKNASKATTLEAQVAQQGLLVGLMGYVPGFNGYQQAVMPDTNALELARTYHKPVIDNRTAQRRLSGANESKWQEMVDIQYSKGN